MAADGSVVADPRRAAVQPFTTSPSPDRRAREESTPRARSPRPTVRRGFTLTELLVALLLLDIGVLALVASGAAVVRELTAGVARTVAVDAARDRLEQLASLACPVDTSGAGVVSPAVRESWSAATRDGVRELADSAEWVERGTRGAVVVRTRVPC